MERKSIVQKLREKKWEMRTLIEKVKRANNEKSGWVERKVELECREAVPKIVERENKLDTIDKV